ncbi:hypothetical protein EIP86_000653 [Pleurotus ostreatoroseus]|nr:hypothetical protein EIP86_000653 [Pleurotus ostreatoroseus]
MFSSLTSTLVNSATSYFYLPVEEDPADSDLVQLPKSRTPAHSDPYAPYDGSDFSCSSASTSSSSLDTDFDHSDAPLTPPPPPPKNQTVIDEILSENDLYHILGVVRSPRVDKLALRRAYLSRSKACHPDKFPGSVKATQAFQKVNVAYDVLSKPSSKRVYDSRSSSASYDFFSTRAYAQSEETFRSVVLGVLNDFLEGDLETVRTLLRAVNDLNPSLCIGDEGIDNVLHTLQAIRERALTCRACVLALHAEVTRLLEVQHAFRQLSYFDLRRRSRLTLELTRIAITLPLALEEAIQQQRQGSGDGDPGGADDVLNRRVRSILRGSAVVLQRLEQLLQ